MVESKDTNKVKDVAWRVGDTLFDIDLNRFYEVTSIDDDGCWCGNTFISNSDYAYYSILK